MASPIDPFDGGVGRRRLLKASAGAGTAAAMTATAGCLDRGQDASTPTVFVFNTGDMTVSMIDADSDELLRSEYIGATASWPSNQYASVEPDVTTLWLNVEGGVFGFGIEGGLEQIADVDTGSNSNWQELTPDGERLVVSAREPAHMHYRIDADPGSDTFGEITGEIDRDGEPAPCDITFGPDGEYSYSPDRGIDTLSVIRTDPFEIAAQLEVEPLGDADVRPFMATASWDGQYLAVENQEGEDWTESIVDISDPESPEETHRFTADEGLTARPITSEWGPESELLYVFGEEISVIDVTEMAVVDSIDLGETVRTGSWNPDRTKLYVPLQESDEVAVIDHEEREVVTRIGVGTSPRSATARSVRPDANAQAQAMAALASLGVNFGGATTTYCEENCHCGHFAGDAC